MHQRSEWDDDAIEQLHDDVRAEIAHLRAAHAQCAGLLEILEAGIDDGSDWYWSGELREIARELREITRLAEHTGGRCQTIAARLLALAAERSLPLAPATTVATRATKYAPIAAYLAQRQARAVLLTFAEIEAILGFPLSASGYANPGWWTEKRLPHVRAWRMLGWEARLDFVARGVHFRRARSDAPNGTEIVK